jgi:hypothetical protein
MKPIISPWWFYFFGVAEHLKKFMLIAEFLSLILGALAIFCSNFVVADNKEEEKAISNAKKYVKFFYIGILVTLLSISIPSKETCYQMMAASIITPNNIESVGESATTVVDYIVDSVDKLLEENTSD